MVIICQAGCFVVSIPMQARGLQANSNFEIRNSKQIQNTNAAMFKTETQWRTVLVI
jgi:hypothetical protein